MPVWVACKQVQQRVPKGVLPQRSRNRASLKRTGLPSLSSTELLRAMRSSPLLGRAQSVVQRPLSPPPSRAGGLRAETPPRGCLPSGTVGCRSVVPAGRALSAGSKLQRHNCFAWSIGGSPDGEGRRQGEGVGQASRNCRKQSHSCTQWWNDNAKVFAFCGSIASAPPLPGSTAMAAAASDACSWPSALLTTSCSIFFIFCSAS